MSETYEHLANLDDPARPYRKVWRCTATDVFVKTYAHRSQKGLGAITFEITASACNEAGDALVREDGKAAVLGGADQPQRHLLTILPDAVDAEPIADQLEREVLFMVARVERAVLNEREAAEL